MVLYVTTFLHNTARRAVSLRLLRFVLKSCCWGIRFDRLRVSAHKTHLSLSLWLHLTSFSQSDSAASSLSIFVRPFVFFKYPLMSPEHSWIFVSHKDTRRSKRKGAYTLLRYIMWQAQRHNVLLTNHKYYSFIYSLHRSSSWMHNKHN